MRQQIGHAVDLHLREHIQFVVTRYQKPCNATVAVWPVLNGVFRCFSFADSVIGIRSNYNMNEQIANPSINASNLSALVASTSTATDGTGLHSHVNQSLFDKNHVQSPQKILESVNVHAVDTAAGGQALMAAPPTITVTPIDETDKTIDGMLDRISHDLDYLLNRMADIPPAPPPPTSVAPPPLHPTNMSVHEVILEEEAEDL